MKTVLWLLLLTLAVPATANEVLKLFTPTPVAVVLKVGEWLTRDRETVYYIQVEGVAATEAEARTQAFRLAVEQAVGSLLLTETAVKNGEVQRHEIINYSSGYIRDFEYVSKKSGSWGTSLVVDVWVAGSKIADRLGVRARSTGDLAGGKIAESLASIQQQNDSGDAVVLAVLTDFPERAWDIKVTQIEYTLVNRDPILNINFTTSWRQEFITSFEEALKSVADHNDWDFSRPGVIFDREPCLAFFSTCKKIYITDRARETLIKDKTIGTYPMVLITIYDRMKTPLYQDCWRFSNLQGSDLYPALFGEQIHQFKLYTKKVLENSLRMDLSAYNVSNMDSVELAVVRKSHCPG